MRSTPRRLVLTWLLSLGVVPSAAAQDAVPLDAVPLEAVPGEVAARDAPRAERPHNVILMIADGFGPASVTLARAAKGAPLSLDPILVGAMQTRPSEGLVTDSAASATALAAGVKTRNGYVGVGPDGEPVETVLELAERRGLATGLVATSTITHATPACFAAHVRLRSLEPKIAGQELEHGIEVLLGGGSAMFLPEARGGARRDDRDLLAEAEERGYRLVADREALLADDATPVLGLFAPGHMAYELDRPADQPSLTEMTVKALELLAPDPDGFFLMVEGSRIDHAAHSRDAAGHLGDALEYDRAVAAALEFARRDGATLVVSTADHETGGMSLSRDVDGEAAYAFDPAVLRRVHRSLWSLTTEVGRAEDPFATLTELAGIDPTESESEEIVAALDAGDGDRLYTALGKAIDVRAGIGWTTGGHTGVDVFLYAFGPGAERFRGSLGNDEVGRRLLALLGADEAAR